MPYIHGWVGPADGDGVQEAGKLMGEPTTTLSCNSFCDTEEGRQGTGRGAPGTGSESSVFRGTDTQCPNVAAPISVLPPPTSMKQEGSRN